MAEMPYGGGKAVILGDPATATRRARSRPRTPALERAWAAASTPGATWASTRATSRCWRGLTPNISRHRRRRRARHGRPRGAGRVRVDRGGGARSSGPPLRGLRVAMQGLGAVGLQLARLLAAGGRAPQRRRRGRARACERAGRGSWARRSRRRLRDLRRVEVRRLLAQRGGRHPERRHRPAPALPRGGGRRPTSSSWNRATATPCTRAGSCTLRTTSRTRAAC